MTTTRNDCVARDAADPLRNLRELFEIPPGVIYLDGNSLGVLPRATPARLAKVAREEWGTGLIRSWNSASWIDLPNRVGDKIAWLIGASQNEVIAADSTSVNLYKVLAVATALVKADAKPGRRTIVSERSNFPTDLYIAQSIAAQQGFTLKLVEPDEIEACLDDSLAVLMLTHVNYRTGRMHRMDELNVKAHACGALTIWDLAHSAGAVPVNLKGNGPIEQAADFAVGCGYKYLNGGPGAPAFVWVHPRHLERLDRDRLWQPLAGWMGHAAPFEFSTDYRPAAGIQRFACGTPAVLALAALDCGVDTLLAAEAHGGLPALRRKSLALSDLFIDLVEARCAGHGLGMITPRDPHQRGSQVNLTRDEGAYAIVQALIERNVIGDFRAPDVLRFGFTPLYTGFADVWDAVEHLRQVLETGEWKEARFNTRAAVT